MEAPIREDGVGKWFEKDALTEHILLTRNAAVGCLASVSDIVPRPLAAVVDSHEKKGKSSCQVTCLTVA